MCRRKSILVYFWLRLSAHCCHFLSVCCWLFSPPTLKSLCRSGSVKKDEKSDQKDDAKKTEEKDGKDEKERKDKDDLKLGSSDQPKATKTGNLTIVLL